MGKRRGNGLTCCAKRGDGSPCGKPAADGSKFCRSHSNAYRRNFHEAPPPHPESPKGLRKLPYGEYLASPHWKRKRRKAIVAAGARCAICGADVELNVHHRTYARRGEEASTDLIVLCRTCHAAHHHGPEGQFQPWGAMSPATDPMRV